MKEANLISILSAYKNLDTNTFNLYLQYHSITIKNSELKDLQVLVDNLKLLSKNIGLYDKYFIGYSIPQIGKEFDLLRIDKETVINIELKRKSTKEKITAQLLRNKYYLSFLKRNTYCYTYVSEDKKLYTLNNTNTLEDVNLRQLLGELISQEVERIPDIDSYFNPSNYLVSPFNSTQEFIKGKYFLTAQQEEIKSIINQQLLLPSYSLSAIKGKAGTGKTLLTYDIAKEIYKNKEVLVIHCGILNTGHYMLRDNYGWDIIPIKSVNNWTLSKYFLIVVDEAQRVSKNQLEDIVAEVKKYSINCIFSYDGLQTLKKGEISANISTEIEKAATVTPFELTSKIRTNKEVASFIHCLFNKNEPVDNFIYKNIEFSYFDDSQDAKRFISYLKIENWKIINYTPSNLDTLPYEQYNVKQEPDNAHTVIGQEFDNVVAIIDEHFYYKKISYPLEATKKDHITIRQKCYFRLFQEPELDYI